MSRFSSEKISGLTPYVPGEQPQDKKYVKLNTNESPFPAAPLVEEAVKEEIARLQLYPDPDCSRVLNGLSEVYGLPKEYFIVSNGSDETLDFAFMAFCDQNHGAIFPDITYGFYPVFAEKNGVPYEEVPLLEDFSVDVEKFMGCGKTVFLANPNAPTGIALGVDVIERIVASNPDNIVVIDEAYVDFGAESCMSLVKKYDNLLVVQTFSKSRSLAGGRIGFGVGCPELIKDLYTIKYSINPYNINRLSAAAAAAVLRCEDYTGANCRTIAENRQYLSAQLAARGFVMTDSRANFIFVKHPEISGELIFRRLREQGVLIRHFTKERLNEYNRISIGSMEQIQVLLGAVDRILEERK